MRIQADKPGVYGGQCAEYCGGPHALMGFVVVAHRPRDFAALMQAWQSPPGPAQSAGAARGERLFFRAGRSVERGVGEECVGKCKTWWEPVQSKKQDDITSYRREIR